MTDRITFIFYTMEAHMRNLIIIPVLLFSLCFGAPSYSADLSKGEIAYQNGDYATALKELIPLAEQGHPQAQYNLGLFYAKGEGVIQDYVKAYMWWNIVAENNDAPEQDNAKNNIKLLEEDMTVFQIADAQTRSTLCVKNNYKGC